MDLQKEKHEKTGNGQASHRSRHPEQVEMRKIWAIERKLAEHERQAQLTHTELRKSLLDEMDALQIACNVPPTYQLHSPSGKWQVQDQPDEKPKVVKFEEK